jgi:glycine dehydrogenase
MIAIRTEIARVESGESHRDDNPLKGAPHTLDDVLEEWRRSYDREAAVRPAAWLHEHKFWPSVNRIDNAFGDRQLVCSCLPVEAYATEGN